MDAVDIDAVADITAFCMSLAYQYRFMWRFFRELWDAVDMRCVATPVRAARRREEGRDRERGGGRMALRTPPMPERLLKLRLA